MKKYIINCKLCDQTHIPTFSQEPVPPIYRKTKTITLIYTCPNKNKSGKVTFPYY
jgi:hypothetical protein